MSETNDMRQEFEAWFSDKGKALKAVTRKGDNYVLMSTRQAWWAWQLATKRATAVERERCATVCEAMKTMGGTEDVERGFNAAMQRSATAIRQGGAV